MRLGLSFLGRLIFEKYRIKIGVKAKSCKILHHQKSASSFGGSIFFLASFETRANEIVVYFVDNS